MDDLDYLREQVRELERKLRLERETSGRAIDAAHNEVAAERRAYAKLRHVLQPWKELLDTIFGELDAAGITDQPTGASPVANSAWDTWKQRLGGKQAEFITVLQMKNGMTREQIRIATHSGWSTVDATLAKLRDLGLVEKRGNEWCLKQL